MNTVNKISSTTITIIVSVIILAAVVGGVLLVPRADTGSPELTAFAQCLADKGAVFYGAFWCPHCRNQKALFGSSATALPYVECSTSDGQGQLAVCTDKGVTNYPTWTFAGGSKMVGEMTLQGLSEKTTCPLPSSVAPATTSPVIVASSSVVY